MAKPSGLTMIPGRELHRYLSKLPVEKVWGIGPNTTAFLRKHNIQTALEYAQRPGPGKVSLQTVLSNLAGVERRSVSLGSPWASTRPTTRFKR